MLAECMLPRLRFSRAIYVLRLISVNSFLQTDSHYPPCWQTFVWVDQRRAAHDWWSENITPHPNLLSATDYVAEDGKIVASINSSTCRCWTIGAQAIQQGLFQLYIFRLPKDAVACKINRLAERSRIMPATKVRVFVDQRKDVTAIPTPIPTGSNEVNFEI
jgi:hypothetical protein